MRVQVVRACLFGGVRQEVGTILDLETAKAIEAIATGRVKRAGDLPPPSPGPMTTEVATDLVAGKKKPSKGAKGESNVSV